MLKLNLHIVFHSYKSYPDSNTTLVKVKWVVTNAEEVKAIYSNTTLVKVKWYIKQTLKKNMYKIQIQHLLKLNLTNPHKMHNNQQNSNTTLVKVKYKGEILLESKESNSNTTLVKVKLGSTYKKDLDIKFKYNTC